MVFKPLLANGKNSVFIKEERINVKVPKAQPTSNASGNRLISPLKQTKTQSQSTYLPSQQSANTKAQNRRVIIKSENTNMKGKEGNLLGMMRKTPPLMVPTYHSNSTNNVGNVESGKARGKATEYKPPPIYKSPPKAESHKYLPCTSHKLMNQESNPPISKESEGVDTPNESGDMSSFIDSEEQDNFPLPAENTENIAFHETSSESSTHSGDMGAWRDSPAKMLPPTSPNSTKKAVGVAARAKSTSLNKNAKYGAPNIQRHQYYSPTFKGGINTECHSTTHGSNMGGNIPAFKGRQLQARPPKTDVGKKKNLTRTGVSYDAIGANNNNNNNNNGVNGMNEHEMQNLVNPPPQSISSAFATINQAHMLFPEIYKTTVARKGEKIPPRSNLTQRIEKNRMGGKERMSINTLSQNELGCLSQYNSEMMSRENTINKLPINQRTTTFYPSTAIGNKRIRKNREKPKTASEDQGEQKRNSFLHTISAGEDKLQVKGVGGNKENSGSTTTTTDPKAHQHPRTASYVPPRTASTFRNMLSSEEQTIYGNRFPPGYQKLDLLGKGGCALVWLGTDPVTNKQYAFKQFAKQNTSKSRSDIQSAKCELSLSKILHDGKEMRGGEGGYHNISALFGTLSDKMDYWLIYELGGISLNKSLYHIKGEFYNGERIYNIKHLVLYSKLKKDTNILKQILYKMLETLDILQSHGIIHADLKPDNILVKFDGANITELKLIDFGSSFLSEEPSSIRLSTPEYLAPEVLHYLDNQHQYNNSSSLKHNSVELCRRLKPWSYDMWSLGAIFLEILTGFPLWMSLKSRAIVGNHHKSIVSVGLFAVPGRDHLKIMNKQKEVIYNLGGVLNKYHCFANDPDGIHLLSRMLELNPKNRISPKEAMAHEYFEDLYIPDSASLPDNEDTEE